MAVLVKAPLAGCRPRSSTDGSKPEVKQRNLRRAVLLGLLMAVGLTSMTACTNNRRRTDLSITARARDRYVRGMDELLSGNYMEAIQELQLVVKNPGYVSYAALARLRIGDALFMQEKYDAAIETYRSFLKQYEGNPNAGYAQFRIGHAFYEQIPSNWFLAPPRHERMQVYVQHASRELSRFVELYPAHRLVSKARKLLDDCEQQLYDHEIYVMRFYKGRNKPAGVVRRLERAMREYPELAATEENYMTLAKAYVQTKKVAHATAMYEAYLARFPGGSYVDQASESLQTLRSLQRRDVGTKKGDG